MTTLSPEERVDLKAKSLGEKMFDALHYDSRTKGVVWLSVPDRSRDYYEIAGMAFAASLTHDETATATIQAMTARAEKAEQHLAVCREYCEADDDVRRVGRMNSTADQDQRLNLARLAYAALLSKGSEEPAIDDLTWLASRTNLELDHGAEDEEADAYWRIHSVNGGVNDREWTLVAIGRTPAEAIRNARAAVGEKS